MVSNPHVIIYIELDTVVLRTTESCRVADELLYYNNIYHTRMTKHDNKIILYYTMQIQQFAVYKYASMSLLNASTAHKNDVS